MKKKISNKDLKDWKNFIEGKEKIQDKDNFKYQEKFNNSFQHGGISLEEMIIPLAIMKGKN